MINIFQLNYDNRLHSWYELRTNLQTSDIKTKCVEIDNWWQNAPMVNHHLHILDVSHWPSPWELLVENTYCSVAKALGMCYTMLLLNITDIKMVEATDMQGEDLVLVLVDDAKYILNYWPDTVLSNKLSNFTIKRNIDITDLELKIK